MVKKIFYGKRVFFMKINCMGIDVVSYEQLLLVVCFSIEKFSNYTFFLQSIK